MQSFKVLACLAVCGLATAANAQDFTDNCGDAPVVGDGSYFFDLSLASNDGTGSCGAGATAPDMWVQYMPTAAGNATAQACGGTGMDTVLGAFTGCGGTELACNDDSCGLQSRIDFAVTPGVPVWIRICGFAGNIGSGTISITGPTPPPPGTWDEAANGGGDAGDLPFSAQQVTGTGTLSAISGTLSAGEADMYEIEICDPANFSASLCNNANFDTQLFLFKDTGIGVEFNDDTCGLVSQLDSLYTAGLQAGHFYIAISSYDVDPVDELGQQIWIDSPFGVERAPDDVGAANPIAAWSGTAYNTGGTYLITFTGACYIGGGGCSVTCDYNQDGGADLSDVFDLANDIASGAESFPGSCIDFNEDGGADTSDVLDLANAIASGTCP